VPRYYLDLREGQLLVSDEEGLEFDSLAAAECEAAKSAAEIWWNRLPKGDAREITVELRNEDGRRVLTVTVSMVINRVDPPPQPPRT
jgi:hypothetical protein